jgi:hypothetical protein
MQNTQTMLKPAVVGSGIDKTCQSQLLYIPQPLKPWMFDEVKYKIARDADKTINRIVNYFPFICQINHLKNFNVQK